MQLKYYVEGDQGMIVVFIFWGFYFISNIILIRLKTSLVYILFLV